MLCVTRSKVIGMFNARMFFGSVARTSISPWSVGMKLNYYRTLKLWSIKTQHQLINFSLHQMNITKIKKKNLEMGKSITTFCFNVKIYIQGLLDLKFALTGNHNPDFSKMFIDSQADAIQNIQTNNNALNLDILEPHRVFTSIFTK